MQEEQTELSSFLSKKIILSLLGAFFALALLVYGASLTNEFVVWDDGLLIYENPIVQEISPWSITQAFTTYDPELYIPLTFLSYQIDYAIAGIEPFFYHFHNLVLHTLNAILILVCVYMLSRSKWIALFCGLVFLVHPVHTEAVVWASARKDTLSTFFFFGSLLSYLFYREKMCHGEPGRTMTEGSSLDRARDDTVSLSHPLYLMSLGCFLLGLLAKVSVFSLPIILLLVDFRDKRKWGKGMLMEKITFFILMVAFAIIALFGKINLLPHATVLDKILMACKSMTLYLSHLVFPKDLSLLYIHSGPITLGQPEFIVAGVIVTVFSLFTLSALKWNRQIFFGCAFFLITVTPTFANFAKNYVDVVSGSDRYIYVPSLGIFYALAFLFGIAIRALSKRLGGTNAFYASASGFVVLMLIFSALSFQRSKVWATTESLFNDVIAKYPESHVAYANRGGFYRRKGNLQMAAEDYKTALAVRPHARTYSNLGAVYRKQGNIAGAMDLYNKALKIDPNSAGAYYGLGLVYSQRGDFAQAEDAYKRSLDILPTYEEVYNNLGALYVSQGRLEEAVEQYQTAIALNRTFVQSYYNLGIALTRLGRKEEAIDVYRQAVKKRPEFNAARINLGILYYEVGDTARSKKQFEEVLQYDPQNSAARSALQQIVGN